MNLVFGSFEENVNSALVSVVVPEGPESIEGVGAVVSTVTLLDSAGERLLA
jgi:hypothetical protein